MTHGRRHHERRHHDRHCRRYRQRQDHHHAAHSRRIRRRCERAVSDNYYKRHDDIPFAERKKLNYDHPNAFDTPLLVQHLDALRAGQPVACPTYDYTVHNRAAETITVVPAKVVVVEGILIFAEPELRERLDIKIFVDTDADVRILRRIVRDVRDRGRDLESIVTQYLTTVKPMHEMFVEPSKRYADIIIPEGGHNQVALDFVMERIRAYVKERD